MSKYYFCKTIGDGSDDAPFSPLIGEYTSFYSATDARSDPTSNGWMMVECKEITDEEHSQAVNDPDIVYFDVENIELDDGIYKIADRAQLIVNLNSQGISVEGLDSSNTLRDILKSIVQQLMLRQNPHNTDLKTHYDN